MKLDVLLEDLEYELVRGTTDVEIKDVIYDSRKVSEGVAFVCIRGSRIDSHDFAADAAKNGAAALIVEKDVEAPGTCAVVKVKDTRLALALMSGTYFDHPSRKMKIVGITGTKGKTTTTHMLKSILEEAGCKVGLIGTNGAYIAGVHYPTKNTTPESYELQQRFAQMVEAGCGYAVMEVSSQGVMMNRVAGIDFDLGVFTNISPDHIGPDEHKDFNEYLECKARLFTLCKEGLVNRDDKNYGGMIAGHTCKMHSFSWTDRPEEPVSDKQSFGAVVETPLVPADPTEDESFQPEFTVSDYRNIHTSDFLGFSVNYKGSKNFEIRVDIPGDFNVYNALAAISAADILGISPRAIVRALEKVKVNGRMELAHVSEHCSVIIDYAHNGIGARSMLATLKSFQPKRLVVVFGCGGNRDPHRRYEMGEAVGSCADLSIITADNSRFEKVEDIIKDIHIGLDPTGGASVDIPDRREAIAYAICNSRPGDLIAVIGKGHEDYQEVNGVRTHLLDSEEVAKNIEKMGW